MQNSYKSLLLPSLIFLLGLVIFTFGLRSQEIISFEARFYLFALEAWRHGLTGFPTTYQHPYPDYPMTGTLLIYGMAKFLGGLNKLTAVLPTAIAAAFILVFTYLIGALHCRRWGVIAVGFLLFTVNFVTEARTIALDIYPALMTVASFYFIYAAKLRQQPSPIKLLLILFAFGFATRGPVGLVIPAGVVCVFYLLEKDFKTMMVIGCSAAVLLGICCLILLGIAYHAGGVSFVKEVMHAEVFGRMTVYQTPPFYFYFKTSFGEYAVTYPLVVLLVVGLGCARAKAPRAERDFLVTLLGWILVIFIGLSIPADKKPRYILAAAPALALFASFLWVVKTEQKYLIYLRRIFGSICFFLPALSLILVYCAYRHHFILPYTELSIFFSVMQLLMIAWYWRLRQRDYVFGMAVMVFLAAVIFIVEPINLSLNHTRDFVKKVERLRVQHQAKLIFYRETDDGLAIKYLADTESEDVPIFTKDSAQLDTLDAPALIIAAKQNFNLLPESIKKLFKIIFIGKIGHDEVVVFSKNVFPPQGAF